MLATADPAFRDDVLKGLAQQPPAIPARWLYDERGSELFDAITRLPSYYPTRTETALLETVMSAIADRAGDGRAVIEFGAGSLTKTPILLKAIRPALYVPIDISGDYLRSSAAQLAEQMPTLAIHPVEANFGNVIELPAEAADHPRLGFFPGSTIGNFIPQSATDLLRHFRATLGAGSLLLIGMDRVKPVERLIEAYDDPEKVTAEFNLNLLHRINRELGSDIRVDAFCHEARWNDMMSRVEMHLVAIREIEFGIADRSFRFAEGQSIHTENSHKYGPRGGRMLLLAGGWTPLAEWTDPARDFALVLAEAQPERFAP